jgi:hypothetical protein
LQAQLGQGSASAAAHGAKLAASLVDGPEQGQLLVWEEWLGQVAERLSGDSILRKQGVDHEERIAEDGAPQLACG